MNVLINEDLYDHEYVARHCSGLEQLVQHVQPFNPEWAYLETGLEPASIRATAREMAHAAPATPGPPRATYDLVWRRYPALSGDRHTQCLVGLLGSPRRFLYPGEGGPAGVSGAKTPKPASDWKAEVQGDYPLVGTGISNKLLEHSVGEDAFIKGWFVYATNLPMTLPGAR